MFYFLMVIRGPSQEELANSFWLDWGVADSDRSRHNGKGRLQNMFVNALVYVVRNRDRLT